MVFIHAFRRCLFLHLLLGLHVPLLLHEDLVGHSVLAGGFTVTLVLDFALVVFSLLVVASKSHAFHLKVLAKLLYPLDEVPAFS